MCECVAILVILPCETLRVVFAGRDRAFLWSFSTVCEHVRLQVFEDASTLGQWAHALFAGLILVIAASALAAGA